MAQWFQRLNDFAMVQTVPYGRRVPPVVLDEVAKRDPDRVYAEYPDKDWERNGYHKVTYGQVANAVNKVSFWLDEILGPAKDFETFAYLGANDLRYGFLVYAAIKTGRKVGTV